jgi:hypothetical protein
MGSSVGAADAATAVSESASARERRFVVIVRPGRQNLDA